MNCISNVVAAISSYLVGGGSGGAATDHSGGLRLYTKAAADSAPVVRATLDNSGNLLIGGTSTAQLDGAFGIVVGGSSKSSGGVVVESSTSAWMTYTDSGQAYMFYDSRQNLERMRLDSSGNLLVGTTANAYAARLNVKSNSDNVAAEFYRQGTTSGAAIVTFNSDSGGAETLKSYIDVASGSLTVISDERLKENIVSINYGLQQIKSLRPVSFELKQGDRKTNLGFIAQEVETILPEAVITLDESMSKTVDNQKMLNKDFIVPVLVKAIQEQQAMIQSLTDRIAQLEAK